MYTISPRTYRELSKDVKVNEEFIRPEEHKYY